MRNGWEKRQFLTLRFCRSRRKGSALKNLAGALHTDGGWSTLSVGWEVKMEILAKYFRLRLHDSVDPFLPAHAWNLLDERNGVKFTGVGRN